MTEKKQNARRPRAGSGAKVSTGAWWKSSTPKVQENEEKDGTATAPAEQAQAAPEATPPADTASASANKRPRRNRRRSRKTEAAPPEAAVEAPAAVEEPGDALPLAEAEPVAKKSGRGRRRGKKADAAPVAEATPAEAPAGDATPEPEPLEAVAPEQTSEMPSPPPKKSGRGRRRGKRNDVPPAADAPPLEIPRDADEPEEDETGEAQPALAARFRHDPNAVYKLLINAEEPEECRVALLENGRLESFHVSTVERGALKNNIYKGRIISVEANLQVAFVDIGTGRNAFLPFNEIHPEYYREDLEDRVRELVEMQEWRKIKIEEVMRRGQEVLVQVVKEVTGRKGASVTTYLSLPGRCLVLLPGSDSAGISCKITGEARRDELRDMMSEFELPEGIGYIVRTAGAGIGRDDLKNDLERLLKLWDQVRGRGQTMRAPALIYQEQDTVSGFLRDHFFPEIQEIVVDTEETLEQVQDFLRALPESQRGARARLHKGVRPIFNQLNIEEQIESIYRPRVALPSGGSIVIDPTEALVAIDVNSGRTSKNDDFEETIFQANMEAAEELARQLRLRDLGGLIVVDFIDMRKKEHILEVERQVRVSMGRDKARWEAGRISARFGLMQISRQKMGAPVAKGTYIPCAHCQGRGVVRSVETQALVYLRRIQTGIIRKKVGRVLCRFPQDVAMYLLNRKKEELAELERRHNAVIDIAIRPDGRPSDRDIEFLAAENAG